MHRGIKFRWCLLSRELSVVGSEVWKGFEGGGSPAGLCTAWHTGERVRVGGQGQRGEVALAHPVGPAAASAVLLCGVGHPGVSQLHC